jgi:hypothetical protein
MAARTDIAWEMLRREEKERLEEIKKLEELSLQVLTTVVGLYAAIPNEGFHIDEARLGVEEILRRLRVSRELLTPAYRPKAKLEQRPRFDSDNAVGP